MIDDPRTYYIEDCYALRGCMHCPDCLAFALKFYNLAQLPPHKRGEDTERKKRAIVIKFLISSIASENLPCKDALSSENLKDYIDKLLSGKAKLPNCHYDFI